MHLLLTQLSLDFWGLLKYNSSLVVFFSSKYNLLAPQDPPPLSHTSGSLLDAILHVCYNQNPIRIKNDHLNIGSRVYGLGSRGKG